MVGLLSTNGFKLTGMIFYNHSFLVIWVNDANTFISIQLFNFPVPFHIGFYLFLSFNFTYFAINVG